MLRKYTCPDICPGNELHGQTPEKIQYAQAGQFRKHDLNLRPYVPGFIKPPSRKVHPPEAPPRYLPQVKDSTSGDFLTMGPIGPWAPGHMDWTPHAGMTGVRPVVEKYSITRYSKGEWRKNNEKVLARDEVLKEETKKQMSVGNVFVDINASQEDSNKKLDNRIKDLKQWKKKVENAVNGITDEINILEENRAKLKGACQILMLPESISKECLELRTHRLEPDLVRDKAEQELITEVSLVGEIRRVFTNTLSKVEEQLAMNKAAKALIESDWSDKMVSMKLDVLNSKLTPESTLLQYHSGVDRWPENATSLEYWKHFCAESIRNCEEVQNRSKDLRADLMTAIVQGGQDLKTQAERTDAALADTVSTTEELVVKLEETLRHNLQQIADIETFMDELKDNIRKAEESSKSAMTRLQNRNYERPNVENCRDEAQYALMKELKVCKAAAETLKNKLRDTESFRSSLMKYRGDLEKEIACKRKSLLIDGDRLVRVRKFIPSPEEFASG